MVEVPRLELESASKPRPGVFVATRIHVQGAKLGTDGGVVRILLGARFEPLDFPRLERRVQEGQRLLTESEQSVGEVALGVGFYDQSHFTKHFRRVTGMTPLAYRPTGWCS